MQGNKPPLEPQMFVYGDPYAHLPRSGFYQALEGYLDLEWVREATTGLYADGIGRPSIDPVVFVKLMLVAYFENIVTDSELEFRAADSLTVRRFLGYSLEEQTPERTTILKTRQRWPIEVFEAIFTRVLEQLAEHGLLKGKHLGTDTVLVDANASMKSLRHRELGCTYSEFVKALYAQDGQALSASQVAARDAQRPKKGSNQDWVSATDPDAAVAVHRDGHTALSYRLDATVDLETGVMVQVGVQPGDVRDSVDLGVRVEEVKANLEEVGIAPQTLTADRGHHSEENVAEVEAQGIAPIIRQQTGGRRTGISAEQFTYLAQTDEYLCPAGQRLRRLSHTPREGWVRYQARGKVCRACPHFGVCTTSKSGRILQRSVHQEAADRNRERVHSDEGRALLGKHRHRAEVPWAYAKAYGGLGRLSTRGLTNATKKALVQGIGWNVMRLVAHLSGLTPRGWSALRDVSVRTFGRLRHWLRTCGDIAHLLGLLALATAWVRRGLRARWALSRLPNFSAKRCLSRAC